MAQAIKNRLLRIGERLGIANVQRADKILLRQFDIEAGAAIIELDAHVVFRVCV